MWMIFFVHPSKRYRVFPTGTPSGKVPYSREAPEQLPNPATADELIMNGILKTEGVKLSVSGKEKH